MDYLAFVNRPPTYHIASELIELATTMKQLPFLVILAILQVQAAPNHANEHQLQNVLQTHIKLDGVGEITICSPQLLESKLPMIVLFTHHNDGATKDQLCSKSTIVTFITDIEDENVASAVTLLKWISSNGHTHGASTSKVTVIGEKRLASVAWQLLQQTEAEQLFHQAILYDVIPGLHGDTTDLEVLQAKPIIFGFAHNIYDSSDSTNHISHVASSLSPGSKRLAKTLSFYYGKENNGRELVEDVTLYQTYGKGLEIISEEGLVDVFIYENHGQNQQLLDLFVGFASEG